MSNILKSVHRTTKGLKKSGVIDETIMRKFNALCLTGTEELTPMKILDITEEVLLAKSLVGRTIAGHEELWEDCIDFKGYRMDYDLLQVQEEYYEIGKFCLGGKVMVLYNVLGDPCGSTLCYKGDN